MHLVADSSWRTPQDDVLLKSQLLHWTKSEFHVSQGTKLLLFFLFSTIEVMFSSSHWDRIQIAQSSPKVVGEIQGFHRHLFSKRFCRESLGLLGWVERRPGTTAKERREPPSLLAAAEPTLTFCRPEWIKNSILTALQQESRLTENPWYLQERF